MENNEMINSVKFLFAKPYYQGIYLYSMDDLDNMIPIDKNELKELLIKLKCLDFIKINYLLERNFPLFFDIKNKKIREFKKINDINESDIRNSLIEQMKETTVLNEESNYEKFFGTDSEFYKFNFSEEMFNKWQSSTNTRQFIL